MARQDSPEYSGKQIERGDFLIFSSKRSFLFRKRIMEVSTNHLLLQMESNSFMLSFILKFKTINVKVFLVVDSTQYQDFEGLRTMFGI